MVGPDDELCACEDPLPVRYGPPVCARAAVAAICEETANTNNDVNLRPFIKALLLPNARSLDVARLARIHQIYEKNHA